MKAILKGAAIAAVSLAGAQAASAATGNGTATVDIVESLTVAEDSGLNFGNIIPSTGASYSMTVANDGTAPTTDSNYLGGASRGEFTVNGTPSQLIVFSNFLDTSGTAGANNVTLTNGTVADDMVASLDPEVTADGTTTYTLDGTTGDYSFGIGGTLTVGDGQTEGTYNGTYTFDVNYQ